MGPLPLYTRCRAIEAVLNEILGLHNKPKAAVHSVRKLTGPKKKKKKKKNISAKPFCFSPIFNKNFVSMSPVNPSSLYLLH